MKLSQKEVEQMVQDAFAEDQLEILFSVGRAITLMEKEHYELLYLRKQNNLLVEKANARLDEDLKAAHESSVCLLNSIRAGHFNHIVEQNKSPQ